jgi:ketosteroid isomerase-like protein
MGDNARMIEAAYAAFEVGDIPTVLGMLHDDVEWTSPRTLPHGGEFHGRVDVERFFAGLAAAWDPLTIEVQQIDEIGDLVVVLVRMDGVRLGKPEGYGAAHVFRIGNGKIRNFHEYVDTDSPID